STSRAPARCTASKMIELGSPPSAPRTMSAPTRSAHSSSCSAAAARNVSPAAMRTERPSSRSRFATLPIVVVLPTPFTPTNNHTLGAPGVNCSVRSPARRAFISRFTASTSCAGSVMPSSLTRARTASRSSVVSVTPTSARSNASSRSSHVVSSIFARERKSAKTLRAFASRSRNDGLTATSGGAGGASVSASSISATVASSSSDGASAVVVPVIGRGGAGGSSSGPRRGRRATRIAVPPITIRTTTTKTMVPAFMPRKLPSEGLLRFRRAQRDLHGLLRAVALEHDDDHAVTDERRRRGVGADAEEGELDRLARDELVRHRLREVDRDQEAHPRVRAALRDDRVGDPEHTALAVGDRATRVARVDRCIDLYHVDGAAGGLLRAVDGADDAGGDRLLEPERAADGDRRLTDLDLHPEREAGDVEPAAGVDLHHGDVAGVVAADHVTLLHGAVGETHADGLARVADDVRGGEDVALVAVDHAGAEAGVRL